MKPMINRRDFLKCRVAGAVGTVLPGLEAAEDVRLESWELVEIPSLPKKLNPILKLTAANGAVGFSKPVARDIAAAAGAVKDADLLEHDDLGGRSEANPQAHG